MKIAHIAPMFCGALVAGLIALPSSLSPVSTAVAVATIPQASTPLIAGDYLVAAPGQVEPASEEIRVAASVTGLIKEVAVKEGDTVHRGDVLARLESDDYAAHLAKAEAALQLSEAELRRVMNGARPAERNAALAAVQEAEAIEKNAEAELARRHTLGAQGITSRQAVDQAEQDYAVAQQRHKAAFERYSLVNDPARDEDIAIAQARVAAARASVDEAQAALNKTVIRSPLDGTVLRIYRRPGELLSTFAPDQYILTVGDLSALYVRAEIDEADIAKIELGMTAVVTAEAFGGQRFAGKIVHIAETLGKKKVHTDEPTERTDTKVLEVLIELVEPNPLRPGLRVNTFITRPAVSARPGDLG